MLVIEAINDLSLFSNDNLLLSSNTIILFKGIDTDISQSRLLTITCFEHTIILFTHVSFEKSIDLMEKLSIDVSCDLRFENLYLSLAQDHRDREWTDGRRSRQGPMTGWSWTLAAFRGSFAVPKGTIYYRG